MTGREGENAMSDELQNKILDFIKNELADRAAELDTKTSLAEVMDSTAVMEIVVWIEAECGFDVEIDDITPDNFGSVEKLVAYIQKNTG